MKRIIVVTNRNREESPVLRRQLSHQFPQHQLYFYASTTILKAELSDQPNSAHPQLILLDGGDHQADNLLALREFKADPALRRIPVLMLTARATEKQLIAYL